MQKIVIVMPAWKEADNVDRMIEELVDHEFPKIEANMYLLVVDNHSKDETYEIVKKASETRKNVQIIQQGDKSGLGWAYISGFKYAM